MPFFNGDEGLLQLNNQGFDFNVQFEQLFFSILPSALFIISSLWRTLSRAQKPTVVHAPVFQLIKVGAITTYIGLELALLILVAVGSFQTSSVFIASAVLKLVSGLLMVTLSVVEHSKSARPSALLSSYLFLTLLLDVVQARTLFLSSDARPELTYSSLFSAALAMKVGILLLEAQKKSQWVAWDEKDHSPEETSGIFSLGVYFWLNKMFWVGYRKVLTLDDLYPLDSALRSQQLHEAFARNMDYATLRGDKFGLVKVLTQTLKVQLLLPIPPRLALLGFTFCQPLFLEKLLDYLAQPDPDANTGYGLIGASVLIYAGLSISTAFMWYFHKRAITMMRSILVTEIFQHATRAQLGRGDDTAALTLMSTDLERIRLGVLSMHDMWATVLQVAIASWLLYNRLGLVFLVPIVVVALSFGGLVFVMNMVGESQKAWMAGVQKRVGLTATVIASMKNLKISGLTTAVGRYVQKLRVDELGAGARFRILTIVAAFFGYTPLIITPPLTFAFAQRTLDVSTMFTSLSYLLLLTVPLSLLFQRIPQFVSALACLERIQKFLEGETREDVRQVLSEMRRDSEKASPSLTPEATHTITVQDGYFGWTPDTFVLRSITTRIPTAALTIIIGPVGSGKSTLCKALLGELPAGRGTVAFATRPAHVGYCDQTAFLFNGSIRDNIVGSCPYNAERYNEIIQATALRLDLATLPLGDLTNVGSEGITLSGGQKQRVSLARALYLQTDLLILDDVFSGLDAGTEEHVFRHVFGPEGLIRRRRTTVVLCTHSIRHLPAADYIVALGEGTIVEQGTFGELMAGGGYVQRLGLRDLSDSDDSSEQSTAPALTGPEINKSDDLLPTIVEPDTDERRQMGDRTVYRHYLHAMGPALISISLLMAALWGLFMNFPTVWLKYWTDDIHAAVPAHSSGYYIGLYALFQLSGMTALILLGFILYVVSVKRVGAGLHQDALRTLVGAPLGFFTWTDTGIVTNLFSQDLNLVDTELPDSVLNTLYAVAQALGQAGVMLTASPYLGISYPLLVMVLYVMQRFYLRTSRQLRLLDLETKSPLYTHFLDTRKGIATLRAFGFMTEEIKKNTRLIDSSQRPAYLLACVQAWLLLALDLVVMVLAAVLTTLAVQLHSSSGFAGASLITLMGFGESLTGIVMSYTRLETSLGAIARLKTFGETVQPEDKDGEDIDPPTEWPLRGAVELKGVSASYDVQDESPDTPHLALRNIHLTIQAGEKIAICGRTGSGKSSLVALLLKLLDPTPETAANVIIDDTQLDRINRTELRQRLIAVPQEAVFLPEGSSFQENLDPAEVSTADECRAVLIAVNLWNFVQERGGQDAAMGANTLSAGQRQLMSLGRALVRRRARARNLGMGGGGSEGGILLLDEVSSSVDHDTERVMQDIIRAEFQGYTVIAVSHRLDMIMDFDRVVVMDKGEIIEVGSPMVLAAEAGTRFGELVKAGAK